MELYQIKTFVTVAQEGLLAAASKRLNTSQPAVSAHIKTLESELGIILFDRTPKGMRLTAEGIQLLIKAQNILTSTEDLTYTAMALAEEVSGDVRIGLNSDPKLLKISDILSGFRIRYPNLAINYLQRMSWQAPKDILANELDAAFVYSEPEEEKLQVERIELIQLVIVAPIDWQNKVENATLSELSTLPWIWVDEHCPYFKVATELFSSAGQVPSKAVIVEQDSVISKLVSAGAGLSLMPQKSAEQSSLAGQVYISDVPAPKIPLSLIYHKKRINDPIIKAILEIVRSAWQDEPILQTSQKTEALSAV